MECGSEAEHSVEEADKSKADSLLGLPSHWEPMQDKMVGHL